MKALSIRQPWAWRILREGKDIENRDWPTRYRGWVLIHAGKALDPDHPEGMNPLPRGGIVGMVEIVDCVAESASPWFFGRYGFVLRNPRPLPFIPCRGMLGFFTPDIAGQVADLWHKGELSEGQGSKILGMGRIEFRRLCDERVAA